MMKKRIDFGYMHQNPPSDAKTGWSIASYKNDEDWIAEFNAVVAATKL